MTREEFLERAIEVHGDRYDYSKVNFRTVTDKIAIICPVHGEFTQQVRYHLKGLKCPRCSGRKITTSDFIERAKAVHGDRFDYSKTEYNGMEDDVIIICKKHGEFSQNAANHLKGAGCPYCAGKMKNVNDFINNCTIIHNGKYDYSKVNYKGMTNKVIVTCPKHGDFLVRPYNHEFSKSGCPKCSNPISRPEIEVREFLTSLGVDYIVNDRKTLGGHEIDILIPDKMIGIEFDGIRWHNELYKDKEYHLEKTLECSKHGVRLLHIFEDEWLYKKEIWMSMLKNILGISAEKIYARKCEVRSVSPREKTLFLNDNHIQGNVNTAVNLGLYYNGELVSLMTFNKQRINLGGKKCDGCYELSRFCSKLNTVVVGGASRLFRKFITEYKPLEVVSYSDRRWSLGNLYVMLGFDFSHFSRPNYYYVVNDIRENRFKYRKDRLVAEGFDPSKTEHEIMLERKIYRIYDCGTMVWKWKSDSSTPVS